MHTVGLLWQRRVDVVPSAALGDVHASRRVRAKGCWRQGAPYTRAPDALSIAFAHVERRWQRAFGGGAWYVFGRRAVGA